MSKISEEEFILNIGTYLTIYSEDSLKLAEIYTKHANRQIVTGEDMKRALMLRAIKSEDYINQIDFCNTFEEVKNDIKEFYTDSDSIEEYLENRNNTSVLSEENTIQDEPEFTTSLCDCWVCKGINNAYKLFDEWSPRNYIEDSIKETILHDTLFN